MSDSKIFQNEPSDEYPFEQYDVRPSLQNYGGTTAYQVKLKVTEIIK